MSAFFISSRSGSEIYRWRDQEPVPEKISLAEANRRHDLASHQVSFDRTAKFAQVNFDRFLFCRRRGAA